MKKEGDSPPMDRLAVESFMEERKLLSSEHHSLGIGRLSASIARMNILFSKRRQTQFSPHEERLDDETTPTERIGSYLNPDSVKIHIRAIAPRKSLDGTASPFPVVNVCGCPDMWRCFVWQVRQIPICAKIAIVVIEMMLLLSLYLAG